MRALIAAGISVASIFIASADAEEKVSPRPIVILQKVVEGIPKGDKQEIRMLIGVIEPGQKRPSTPIPIRSASIYWKEPSRWRWKLSRPS